MEKFINVCKTIWKYICLAGTWLGKMFKKIVFNLPAAVFWILAYVVSANALNILPITESLENWLNIVALVMAALIAYDLSGKSVETKK